MRDEIRRLEDILDQNKKYPGSDPAFGKLLSYGMTAVAHVTIFSDALVIGSGAKEKYDVVFTDSRSATCSLRSVVREKQLDVPRYVYFGKTDRRIGLWDEDLFNLIVKDPLGIYLFKKLLGLVLRTPQIFENKRLCKRSIRLGIGVWGGVIRNFGYRHDALVREGILDDAVAALDYYEAEVINPAIELLRSDKILSAPWHIA